MQYYPVGVQTFRKIIENNQVYIDKTSLIHKLITNVDYCFLARPRRFGKSLTLSTIASIFRCERELYERNRDIMAGFYRVIKDLDPYLRFTSISGSPRLSFLLAEG